MTLKVGDKIPQFTAKDQNENTFSINEVLGKNNLVIYFYPKDHTMGCTKEACSFRDGFSDFRSLDTKVIGISKDSPASHRKFAERNNLPFTLLSDEDNGLRKKFGVPSILFGLLPGRVTYVVDKSGVVRHIFNSSTQFSKHAMEAKKVIGEFGRGT